MINEWFCEDIWKKRECYGTMDIHIFYDSINTRIEIQVFPLRQQHKNLRISHAPHTSESADFIQLTFRNHTPLFHRILYCQSQIWPQVKFWSQPPKLGYLFKMAATIPNICHFIWIDSGGWGWPQAVSLGSALANTRYEVWLHTNLKPGDAAEYDPYDVSHERLKIVPRAFPSHIHGVKARAANLSDIARIEILYEHGGIYSDLDILWLRSVEFGVPPASKELRLISAFENPSYKTVADAFIAAVPRHPALAELLTLMDYRFACVAAAGVLDLTVFSGPDAIKYHTILWKLIGNHLKAHADLLLGRREFYKNGWRRIGRQLRAAGVPLRPIVDERLLGSTADRFDLTGAVGYHWYATMYPLADQMLCPAIAAKIGPAVARATDFWSAGTQT